MGLVSPVLPTVGSTPRGDGESLERSALNTLINEFNGNIQLANLHSEVKADWEYAYSSYKTAITRASASRQGDTAAADPYVLGAESAQVVSANGGKGVFYLDPAWFAAGSRTKKLRVAASLLVGATAPAATITVGLYPVTAVGGSSTVSVTLGAVVAGSTVAFASPSASSLNQANSGDFTAPAADYYVIAYEVSVDPNGSSTYAINVLLQVRQV